MYNEKRKAEEVKLGGASFMPIPAKLNITRQASIDLPLMIRSKEDRSQNYR